MSKRWPCQRAPTLLPGSRTPLPLGVAGTSSSAYRPIEALGVAHKSVESTTLLPKKNHCSSPKIDCNTHICVDPLPFLVNPDNPSTSYCRDICVQANAPSAQPPCGPATQMSLVVMSIMVQFDVCAFSSHICNNWGNLWPLGSSDAIWLVFFWLSQWHINPNSSSCNSIAMPVGHSLPHNLMACVMHCSPASLP